LIRITLKVRPATNRAPIAEPGMTIPCFDAADGAEFRELWNDE
jgi:hypothetical protein